MEQQVFEVDEAEALIPRLELFIEGLQRCARELRDHVSTVAAEQGTSIPDLEIPQLLRLRPDLHRLVEEMNRLVHQIEALGCIFKDLELGLVDFPAEIGGESVYLCWQYGEKAISFWHRVDEGLDGRQPLHVSGGSQRRYLQ